MQTPLPTTQAPAIGQPWPGQGGIYCGIARGLDGQPDHHLILAAVKPPQRLAWAAAIAWAKTVEVDGHADFDVPTRRESGVLFGNAPELFEQAWHWTSTQGSDSGYAWYQDFGHGSQNYNLKSHEGRARAVRRLPINPLILSSDVVETAEVQS